MSQGYGQSIALTPVRSKNQSPTAIAIDYMLSKNIQLGTKITENMTKLTLHKTCQKIRNERSTKIPLIFQMLFKLTLPLFLQKSLHFLPSSCPEFYLSTFPKFKIFLFFCYLVVMLSQFIFVNTTIHLVLSM